MVTGSYLLWNFMKIDLDDGFWHIRVANLIGTVGRLQLALSGCKANLWISLMNIKTGIGREELRKTGLPGRVEDFVDFAVCVSSREWTSWELFRGYLNVRVSHNECGIDNVNAVSTRADTSAISVSSRLESVMQTDWLLSLLFDYCDCSKNEDRIS